MIRGTLEHAKSVIERLITFFEAIVEDSQKVLTYLRSASEFLNIALQQGSFTATIKQTFQKYIQWADAAGMPKILNREGRGDLQIKAREMEQEIDREVPDPPETIAFEGKDIKNTGFVDRD